MLNIKELMATISILNMHNIAILKL